MPKPQRKNEAIWMEESNRWRIRVQARGKRKAFYSSAPGRKGKIEAERKADEWLDNGGSDDPRLEAVHADYLAEVKRTTGSGNYRNAEQLWRLYLLPRLKLKRMGSITLQDWQDCITAAYEAGLSKKTCQNIRGAITSLYNYAKKNRVYMERPEGLTINRDAPVGERTILQPDQLRLLFQQDNIIDHGHTKICWFIHAWRFAVLTGLRRGEIAGLKWTDLGGSILHISRAINSQQVETRGKNDNAKRYLALSPIMEKTLADQRDALKKVGLISPWIFPNEEGERINPNIIYKRWIPYRKQHNIKSSIHELRHTMISLVSPEIPDALLKPMVGHSKAMNTDIYRHVVDGNAERAALLVEEVFVRVLKPEPTKEPT